MNVYRFLLIAVLALATASQAAQGPSKEPLASLHGIVVNAVTKEPVEDAVVEDGNIITSRGAGTAIEFAAAVVKRLAGENAARDILARIQYRLPAR